MNEAVVILEEIEKEEIAPSKSMVEIGLRSLPPLQASHRREAVVG
jgi:hypothetical protein